MFHPMMLLHKLNPTGISSDSRLVKPGDCFFALNAKHIKEALEKGASVIVCDEKQALPSHLSVPIIPVNNLQQKIGFFADEFYSHPSRNLNIIGITGTNGKTSCSHFLAQMLEEAGYLSAVIGTLGNGQREHLSHSDFTTPDAVQLQSLLSNFCHQKIDFVSMEVSSHGLDQGRTNGTIFDTAVFTNLTQDHLDYHQTMEQYANAKYKLFEQSGLKHAVLNIDDSTGLKWAYQLHQSRKALKVYGVSVLDNGDSVDFERDIPSIIASKVKTHEKGLTADVSTPWGKGTLESTLWGKFNLTNILSVLTCLLIYKIPFEKALSLISHIKPVTGRMQRIENHEKKKPKQNPLVIIDYAHTPDALLKTLQAIKEHCQGELWCVFGAGGDRDKLKRPQMGKIAEMHADQVILTSDNPRSEKPLQIIHDILEGISDVAQVVIEPDRAKAIAYAISCAHPDDVVLVAGKGHENTQEISGEKIPFSDILTVKMCLMGE